ncbi:DUF3037 domain-containing protein [Halothiobacillus sp.]|uniref:DUF3037 domain-containing protein n=1 Tax=Halothiobacillus sp. TaxID=1891311 RepID=UPI002AD3C0C3|nr:DUF3037 domain-containing protein [Halothiobacillus sp.]
MKNIVEYGVIRHQPYPNSTEYLNIGIITFLPTGEIRTHFAANLRRLVAFDPQADIDIIRRWEVGLPEFLAGLSKDEAIRLLAHFGTWRISEKLGRFVYTDEHEYTERVNGALSSLVDA